MKQELTEKITQGSATIGIIGLGYVGLPLAESLSSRLKVVGYDHSRNKIEKAREKGVRVSDEIKDLEECDIYIICVPTPLNADRKPDLSYVKEAGKQVSKILGKGNLVILESTTYPGTTTEILVPILERSQLKPQRDFAVAYSPERIDPGNREYTIENTPKLVGGIDKKSGEMAKSLYEQIVEAQIIMVEDCETAEAAKILENIFRDVNISLANEMAMICENLGINVWEVIEAASTKPFGFMSFYPGPGVGGHCIPLDPHYLSYKSKRKGYPPRFIELSAELNDYMRLHTINLVEKALRDVNKRIIGSKIAVLGLSYKKGIGDVRESPAKSIIEELTNLGAQVKVYDPYVREMETSEGKFKSTEGIQEALKGSDCAVFTVDHERFLELKKDSFRPMRSKAVVDCRNLFPNGFGEEIAYYGIGKPR